VLGLSVNDVFPVSQCASKIRSLAGFDQIVADPGGQGVSDLLHQRVAGAVPNSAEKSVPIVEVDTYRAMIGVRRCALCVVCNDSKWRMRRADSKPSVTKSVGF
jgi:hypothetical protein